MNVMDKKEAEALLNGKHWSKYKNPCKLAYAQWKWLKSFSRMGGWELLANSKRPYPNECKIKST